MRTAAVAFAGASGAAPAGRSDCSAPGRNLFRDDRRRVIVFAALTALAVRPAWFGVGLGDDRLLTSLTD